jgi:all-trans-retinol 13,14-reductase
MNSNKSNDYAIITSLFTIGIFSLYIFIKKKKKSGKNPFENDTRLERSEYVYDKKIRDSIIKCGYSKKSIEECDDYDAIIIGSGIGGLMTAAILARSGIYPSKYHSIHLNLILISIYDTPTTGKKVLVLEKHDQAGGCCHSFNEKGYEFDTGIHYIGEMRNNTSVKFLFDQVSNNQLGIYLSIYVSIY